MDDGFSDLQDIEDWADDNKYEQFKVFGELVAKNSKDKQNNSAKKLHLREIPLDD